MDYSILEEKVVQAVGWNAVSVLGKQGLRFAILAILAHLLMPADFGLVGMAFIFIGVIGVLSELGLSSAIIQRKDLDSLHLSTSYWSNIIMGLFLFAICVFVSPYIARFFREPLLRPIIFVSSLSFVIAPFGVAHRALLEREFRFKKLCIVDIGEQIAMGGISITLALLDFGVWSIICGTLAGRFVSILLYFRVLKWRPLLSFSKRKFNELFRFGLNVMGFNFLDSVAGNLDYLIIGKIIGSTGLGMYTLAYNLTTFPQRNLSTILSRVTFPAFSRIQDDNLKMNIGYLKLTKYLSLISSPLLIGLAIVAPDFVRIIYGMKWMPIIAPLRVLCLMTLLYSLTSHPGQVWMAKGRPDIRLYWSLIMLLTITISVLIGVKYGILGVAIALTIRAAILFPFSQIITSKLIGMKFQEYLSTIFPPLICSMVLLIVLVPFRHFVLAKISSSDIANLLISITVGAIVYCGCLKLLYRDMFFESKRFISMLHQKVSLQEIG